MNSTSTWPRIKQNLVDLIGYQLEASLPNAKENFNELFNVSISEIGKGLTNLMNDILLLGKNRSWEG